MLRAQLATTDIGMTWEVFHALVVEHGIHNCLTGRPRCDSAGYPRRDYAEPRKCADHCPPCGGCPLASICPRRGVDNAL